MTKKNKVINLFDRLHVEEDESKKYSVAIDGLVQHFQNSFPEDYYLEDIIEFAINAWNMTIMKGLVPAKEFKKILKTGNMPPPEKAVLDQMMQYKTKNYINFDRFIVDFTLYDIHDEVRLTLITQQKEEFLMDMVDDFEEDNFLYNEADEDEAYINRAAMMLTPKMPFVEWIKSVDADLEKTFIKETNTYLLNETIDDLDKWLQKKFDVFFMLELAEWHSVKKEWPMKRTYKMFSEWFEVSLSTSVYDMVKKPIFKE